MTDVYKLIGKRLRKHRRLMRLSQTEVAKKLNLKSTSIISRWERGITIPSSENLIWLSTLYKTLANELMYDLAENCQKELYPENKPTLATNIKSGNDP